MPDRTRPMEDKISTVPIHLKNDADRQRSGRIQQYRHRQDRQYAESAQLPFVLFAGTKNW